VKNIAVIPGEVKLPTTFKKAIDKMGKRKKGTDIVAHTYKKTNLPDKEKKAQRLFLCGKTVIYAENPTGREPIQIGSIRCGIRLCPSCSWIRSNKIFQSVHRIITASDFAGKEFIFLTLTVRNCRGDSLEGEIKRLLSAWQKLTENKNTGFRKSFLGTFRALEVNYSWLRRDYHPHLHVMAAVEPDYFKKSNKNYISQKALRKMWRDACGLDYDPRCSIKKVYSTTEKQVAEVAKYTVKSVDYLNRPNVIEVLDPALRSKRLIAYGGLFKSVRARLALPNEDCLDDIPPAATEELLSNPYIRKIILEWNIGLKTYEIKLFEPSNDPDEWLRPDRIAAEILKMQANEYMRR